MKKTLYVILLSLLGLCACSKMFYDPNVSIYTYRTGIETAYFYLNRDANFYLFDDGPTCEFGVCKFNLDTLYCYPRFYKDNKSPNFVSDSVSNYYCKITENGPWQDVYMVKYLISGNKLYVLSIDEPNISGPVPFFGERYFEKIDLKDVSKYRKEPVIIW